MNKNHIPNVFVYILTGFSILFCFFILASLGVDDLFALIVSIIVGVGLLLPNIANKEKTGKQTDLKKISSKKEDFYKSKGLSSEDIIYFRETMHQAKNRIILVEKNMTSTEKLCAIEHRNHTIQLSKALFKEIIKEPNRLHEVDQFLYVHLPSLTDLTEKYIKIDNHQKKSQASFDILERSVETIDEMCQQIAEDYVKFRSTDIEDMDLEVKHAKNALNKNSDIKESIEDDEV